MKKTNTHIAKWIRVLVPSLLIVGWFAIGGVGGPYFGKISEVASNDQATFLPASAESTQVNQEIKKFQSEKTIPAIIVFSNNDSILSDATRADIKQATSKLSSVSGVVGEVSPPIIADDEKAAIVVVNVSSDQDYKTVVPELNKVLNDANLSVSHNISGPIGFLNDLAKAFSGIDGILLGVALAVVFVILLIVYRSPILPFIVLLNSIFALSGAILLVFYLAKIGAVTINGQVQGILFILVIGAATDYALLFVARYREELLRHEHAYHAMIRSWKRSIEPIAAAGGTVIAGLLCLLLSDLNSNKALGPVGAIGIVLAIASTMTLLPSLLMVWGRKVFWPRIPHYVSTKLPSEPTKGIWPKAAALVAMHPRRLWIGITVFLVIMSAGLTQLKADGVSQGDLLLGSSEARDGQDTINKHFPGGSGSPTQIIASSDNIDTLVTVLEADKGVDSVAVSANNSSSGSLPLGRQAASIKQSIRSGVQDKFAKQKAAIRQSIQARHKDASQASINTAYRAATADIPSKVESIVRQAYPFKDATPKVVDGEILLEVTLKDDPDSKAAQMTVQRLRPIVRDVDSSARIGGTAAVQLDTRVSSEHDRAVVIPAVLVVITIILMVLLRSIVAPILLLLTTMLSFAAILGISALVFNHLFGFPGADPSVVLYGFIFLVALGIDYNIFLMTRVREESLKKGTRKGTHIGLIATGSVITSAGLVLASTFAALAVIPILFLVQLAFVVAAGVLIDTIIVRSLLVPALSYDIGRLIWLPSKKHKD